MALFDAYLTFIQAMHVRTSYAAMTQRSGCSMVAKVEVTEFICAVVQSANSRNLSRSVANAVGPHIVIAHVVIVMGGLCLNGEPKQ